MHLINLSSLVCIDRKHTNPSIFNEFFLYRENFFDCTKSHIPYKAFRSQLIIYQFNIPLLDSFSCIKLSYILLISISLLIAYANLLYGENIVDNLASLEYRQFL